MIFQTVHICIYILLAYPARYLMFMNKQFTNRILSNQALQHNPDVFDQMYILSQWHEMYDVMRFRAINNMI